MKKRLLVSLSITLILVLSFSLIANAASTTKKLSTNFTLINLSNVDAEGNIQYKRSDGSPWTGSTITSFGPGQPYQIPANGGQLVVRQYSDSLQQGSGSVIVSSNVELGAVVQLRLPPGSSSLPTSGAYVGGSEVASKWYVPLAQANRSTATGVGNTQIMIQNAGTTVIPTITVTLLAEPGSGSTPASFIKTISNLQPGATFTYDLADEKSLKANWSGSAEVDAGGNNIVVVVNSFNGPHGLRTYNAFPESNVGPKWAIPLFASKLSNGLNTSVSVQNLSGGSIPVNGLTLDCGAFKFRNNAAIPDKGTFGFNPVADVPGRFPTNWQGACVIDAGSRNVVAFVLMRRVSGNGDQAAYEAINYNSGGTRVFIPLMAKRLPNGFATSAVIVNLSNQNAQVKLTWTPSPDECQASSCKSYIQDNVTIPANGNLALNLRTGAGAPAGMPDGWQGTLKVEPSGGSSAPIHGYVVLSNLVNSAGDNYRAHLALSLP